MRPDDRVRKLLDGAEGSGSLRLSVLLAMAMFVLVVDTSIENVSITAVARDLDATVSEVQSARWARQAGARWRGRAVRRRSPRRP